MLKFIILTLLTFAHSFDIPVITTVEQLTESSIRIKWKFFSGQGNEKKFHFSRYRIQYSTDYFEKTIGEWPAQTSLMTTDTNGQIVNITTTQSNIECFNECIKLPQCVTATKLPDKTDNCLMKSNHDRFVVSPHSNQVIRVNEYQNDEAILFNLPYDQIYRFRVALFDSDTARWTLFSEPSQDELNTKISLQTSLERVDYSTLKVKWKQTGNFTNYKLSRYVVKISTNEEPFETKHDISKLISTTIEPSYFELPLSTSIGVFLTEGDCFNKCRNMLNCIQYVFYTNNGSCHLADRYNPMKGYKDQGVIAKFIQSNSNELLLEDLSKFVNYRIQVEYLTPFGTNGTSNMASYVLTNLKPILRIKAENEDFTVTLNWTVVEPVRLRTYQIYFSINESNYFNEYFESNLIDFVDPNEYSFDSADLAGCFNKCVANSSCLAFSWHKFNKICTFKTTKAVSRTCELNSFCSSILDYSSEIKIKSHYVNTKYCYMISVLSDFGFIGDKSNQACFKWNATVTNKVESTEFIQNESTSFRCILSGLGSKQIEAISWYKNDERIDEKKQPKNMVISHREMRLKIFELNPKVDDGVYHCMLTLKNGQQIYSNKVDMRVKFGPIIKFHMKNDRILLVEESSDVKLVCKAEGYPIPEVKFKFNGNLMVNFESKYDKYSKDITIFLRNVTKKHNGTYSCYLNDEVYKSIDILIKYGPQLLSESKNITIEEFEMVNLVCTIEKYPKPNIIWKNLLTNELIDQNSYTYINSKTVALIFERATRNHTGIYACFDRDHPNLSTIFGVFVKYPSHFIDQSRTIRVNARENDSVDMNCTAVGYPLPTIEWKSLRNDQIILPNVTVTTERNITSYLTLKNLLKNDAGNYSCSIPEYSSETIIFNLNILTKPERPIIVEVETILNDRMRIIWCIDEIGNSPLTHAILEWSANFSNMSSVENYTFINKKVVLEPAIIEPMKNLELNVANVSIDDESLIRLSVVNSIGLSEPSGPFKLVKRVVSIKIKASFVTATLIAILSVAALALIFSTIIFTIKLNKFWRNDRRFDQDSRCKLNMSLETASNKKNLKLLNQINGFGGQQHEDIVMSNHRQHQNFTENFSMSNLESRLNLVKSLNSISSGSGVLANSSGSRIVAPPRSKKLVHPSSDSPPSLVSRSRNDLLVCRISDQVASVVIAANTNNTPAAIIPTANTDPHVYDRQSLLKRFTEDFYTLDKDMHFEYCDIKNPDNKTFYDSLKMQNERKCRYKHIYPYDDNRVKLNQIPGKPDSDFINASYVAGFNTPKKFIAAQGPTRDTASDFLRMLVEKEVKIIVMLTQVYEGDPPMLKSWPYWNDNNVIKFGTYTSEVKSKSNKIFYELRKIEIKNNEVQLEIDHYYYKEWPDKLCPVESQSLIELIHCVNQKYSVSHSHILVHCSAGIGRTGSFIAISNLIDSMRETNEINSHQLVTEMRKQRPHLVQNWEQYKYIHQTLLEWCLFGYSSVDLDDRDYLDTLLQCHKMKIENEFRNINLLKDKLRLKTYSYDFLIKKDLSNLPEQILSVEKTLEEIKLVLKDVLHVKIPTLKCDFLLTIEPNSKSINDFLMFLVKMKPISLVSFSPFEASYIRELSNLGNMRNFLACGITLKCTEVTTSQSLASPLDLHRIYELELTDTKNNNEKFTTRYYTSAKLWQVEERIGISEDYECQLPDCEPISYLRFVNDVLGDLRQRLSSPILNRPIDNHIVLQATDHKSYEKCAIFMCAYYLLLSMHSKRRFDVVHIVRLLRKNYSKFISKREHYVYLYQLCSCRQLLDLIRRD